jgi:enamine deaminase RidA (YjgF/YER057c/UK114 family)
MPMTIKRLSPRGRYSGAVAYGGMVHLAGQVARNPVPDVEAQTADILEQIDALLAEAGSGKQHLLSVHVFLADLADFDAMNRAWDRWADRANPPARATVQSQPIDPRWQVEISGFAALP